MSWKEKLNDSNAPAYLTPSEIQERREWPRYLYQRSFRESVEYSAFYWYGEI